MDGPWQLALALPAVIALIALTRLLGFTARPVLAGFEEVRALVQSLPGGFAASRIDLAIDGGGALARDAAGRVAVVAPIGAHFLVRLNDGGWIARSAPGGQLAITGSDFACSLALDARAGDWLEAITNPVSKVP
jgi:hypothetical protein